MSGAIDGARLRDPQLRPIADKVMAGERLAPADGVVLYATADLLGLGTIADFANRRRNGDRVFFSADSGTRPARSLAPLGMTDDSSGGQMTAPAGAGAAQVDKPSAERNFVMIGKHPIWLSRDGGA